MHLTNRDLYYEMIVSKGRGRLTRKAEKLLIILGENAVRKMRSKDDEHRKDCLQSGILALFSSWLSFNEDYSDNAFAYYTEVFKRGMASGHNSIYKRKGEDDNYRIKMYYIHSSNDGSGMHNI